MVDKGSLAEAIGQVMRRYMAYAVLFQDAIARQAGLNSTDLQCLNLLNLHGPMTPSALSERTGLSSGGATTAVIDRLEHAGLVRRVRSTEDRRKVLVVPDTTETGRRIGPLYRDVTARWNDYLDTLDVTQLESALDLLTTAAEINQAEAAALHATPTPRSRPATAHR